MNINHNFVAALKFVLEIKNPKNMFRKIMGLDHLQKYL